MAKDAKLVETVIPEIVEGLDRGWTTALKFEVAAPVNRDKFAEELIAAFGDVFYSTYQGGNEKPGYTVTVMLNNPEKAAEEVVAALYAAHDPNVKSAEELKAEQAALDLEALKAKVAALPDDDAVKMLAKQMGILS